ncbi:MAG: hypothetical protein LW630_03440 [Saprospiraceae bacterium]|jgi:hypothetical protein|nr:hypothetical protein [Saprospiraceae bacterium]
MTNKISTYCVFALLLVGLVSCKNEAGSAEAEQTPKNDVAALEGTGAADVSTTHKLDPTQIVQEGNVAFNFKSQKSMDVYLDWPQTEEINFEENEVYAVFADKTIKETSFKVEKIDMKAEYPLLKVTSVISTKNVSEYRPFIVITVPKKDLKNMPEIRLDGSVIPVFGME